MSRHRQQMSGTTIYKSGGGLPSGYTRLEYVESDNTRGGYIDTEVVPEFDDYIQIEIYRNGTANEQDFGSDNFIIADDGAFEYWRIFRAKGIIGFHNRILYKWLKYVYENKNFSELNFNPGTVVTAYTVPCTKPLYIFRSYKKSKISGIRLSYFKIEKVNGYAKELIPAMRNSDGMVGMYDIANNYFHVPPSGYLTAGPTI